MPEALAQNPNPNANGANGPTTPAPTETSNSKQPPRTETQRREAVLQKLRSSTASGDNETGSGGTGQPAKAPPAEPAQPPAASDSSPQAAEPPNRPADAPKPSTDSDGKPKDSIDARLATLARKDAELSKARREFEAKEQAIAAREAALKRWESLDRARNTEDYGAIINASQVNPAKFARWLVDNADKLASGEVPSSPVPQGKVEGEDPREARLRALEEERAAEKQQRWVSAVHGRMQEQAEAYPAISAHGERGYNEVVLRLDRMLSENGGDSYPGGMSASEALKVIADELESELAPMFQAWEKRRKPSGELTDPKDASKINEAAAKPQSPPASTGETSNTLSHSQTRELPPRSGDIDRTRKGRRERAMAALRASTK